MLLLLKTFNSGEGIDAALLDLTPEYVRWLMGLRDLWTFATQSEALKDKFPYCSLTLSFFDSSVMYFGYAEEDLESIDAMSEEVIELVPAGESPAQDVVATCVIGREWFRERGSTECERIIIKEDGVRWSAYPRFSDKLMETATLPWELVEIAAQRPEVSGE